MNHKSKVLGYFCISHFFKHVTILVYKILDIANQSRDNEYSQLQYWQYSHCWNYLLYLLQINQNITIDTVAWSCIIIESLMIWFAIQLKFFAYIRSGCDTWPRKICSYCKMLAIRVCRTKRHSTQGVLAPVKTKDFGFSSFSITFLITPIFIIAHKMNQCHRFAQ